MNLADVMDEIGDRLDAIPGLRVYRYPADAVQPPAAVVTYPSEYTFDDTYGRGMDRISDLPVVVMVGRVWDRTSRDQIAQWVNGSGATSIKEVLESPDTYNAFHTLRVVSVEFDFVTLSQVEYLAATFILDITGSGS